MKRRRFAFWRPFAFSLAAGALAGCAGQIPHASLAQTELAARQWPDVTTQSLERGREIYIQKCSGCHLLRIPSRYTSRQWPKVLDTMAARAKLTRAQKHAVFEYVMSVSKQDSGDSSP